MLLSRRPKPSPNMSKPATTQRQLCPLPMVAPCMIEHCAPAHFQAQAAAEQLQKMQADGGASAAAIAAAQAGEDRLQAGAERRAAAAAEEVRLAAMIAEEEVRPSILNRLRHRHEAASSD